MTSVKMNSVKKNGSSSNSSHSIKSFFNIPTINSILPSNHDMKDDVEIIEVSENIPDDNIIAIDISSSEITKHTNQVFSMFLPKKKPNLQDTALSNVVALSDAKVSETKSSRIDNECELLTSERELASVVRRSNRILQSFKTVSPDNNSDVYDDGSEEEEEDVIRNKPSNRQPVLSCHSKEDIKSKQLKKNSTNSSFFLSKMRQQEILNQKKLEDDRLLKLQRESEQAEQAKEREIRIQNDILKTRQENNRLLSVRTSSNPMGGSNNPFFSARITVNKPTVSGSSCVASTEPHHHQKKMKSSSIDGHQIGSSFFPCVIHTGLIDAIGDIELYNSKLYSNPDTVSPSFDKDKLNAYFINAGTSYRALPSNSSTDSAESCIYLSLSEDNEPMSKCSFEYSCSFQPRSRIRDFNRSSPMRSQMYPFSQAALNLRACWLSWITSNYLDPYYQSNKEIYLKSLSISFKPSNTESSSNSESICNKSRFNLIQWLEKWVLKRKIRQNQRNEVKKFKRKAANVKTSSEYKYISSHRRSNKVAKYDDEEEEFSDEIDDYTEDDISESYDSDVNEFSLNSSCDKEISNVMIIQGPSGSGKSAYVYECASKLGFKVIEVNASQTRNGALIKKMISEAAQSAHIFDSSLAAEALTLKTVRNNPFTLSSAAESSIDNTNAVATNNSTTFTEYNLILFDEVDIVFEDEDSQLYSSIQQLARISKCPILLTTEKGLDFFKALNANILYFTRPEPLKDAYSILSKSIVSRSSPFREGFDVASISNSPPLLEVICSITDGCLRSCEATIDCIQEIFRPPHNNFNKVVDLTKDDENEDKESSFRNIDISFGAFMNKSERLDFAQFDQLNCSMLINGNVDSTEFTQMDESDIISYNQLLAPVIHEIEPHFGLCSGGFLVKIIGFNFLQRSFDLSQASKYCEVEVLLNNQISCPSVLKSNTLILVCMPEVSVSGTYTFTVNLKMTLPPSIKWGSLYARSDMCGIAKSWINLKHRSFPNIAQRNKRLENFCFEEFIAARNDLDYESERKDNKVLSEGINSRKRLRRSNIINSEIEDSDSELFQEKDEKQSSSSSFLIKRKQTIICEDDTNTQHDVQILAEKEILELNLALFNTIKYSLMKLLNSSLNEPFLIPVSDEIAPGYSSIISDPMDLGTIEKYFLEGRYLKSTHYQSVSRKYCDIFSFVNDVRLVWKNCVTYNSSTSELSKSSYLLSYLFESILRSNLLLNVKSEYFNIIFLNEFDTKNDCGVDENNEIENIFSTSIQIIIKDKEIIKIPSFCLFKEHQTHLHDSVLIKKILNEENNGDCLTISWPHSVHEAALSAEVVSTDTLNEMLLSAEAVKSSVHNVTAFLEERSIYAAGLEYEYDEEISISLVNIPIRDGSSINTNLRLENEYTNTINALNDICKVLDNFSECDIIQDFVLQSCNYSCYDADEWEEVIVMDYNVSRDSSTIEETSASTSTLKESEKKVKCLSMNENIISFAQYYTAGHQLAECTALIRRIAINEFSHHSVKHHSPSKNKSTINRNHDYSLNRNISKDYKQYNSWLDSLYLSSQLQRLNYIRLAQSLLANYNCSKYQNDTTRNGIIANHYIRSLCFLSSTIALDILPMIRNFCTVEFKNDEFHLATINNTDSSSSSDNIFTTRRSSRNRGKTEIKDYVRFAYMKNILNINDDNIIQQHII